MNETQNTALIQGLYEAFGRGDIAFILGNLTSDAVWTTEGPEIIPYTGTRRGPQGALSFFEALDGTLANMKLTTDHYIAQGDMVATFGRFAGTVKVTGQSFDAPVAHYFQIRDGKIAVFVDIAETASIAAAYQGSALRHE
jgi:ketosteroid isomerase-like protein